MKVAALLIFLGLVLFACDTGSPVRVAMQKSPRDNLEFRRGVSAMNSNLPPHKLGVVIFGGALLAFILSSKRYGWMRLWRLNRSAEEGHRPRFCGRLKHPRRWLVGCYFGLLAAWFLIPLSNWALIAQHASQPEFVRGSNVMMDMVTFNHGLFVLAPGTALFLVAWAGQFPESRLPKNQPPGHHKSLAG
jgi:hypothetical protein